MSNIVIIGSGPAGVSAALYAARAGVDTTILTKGPGALDRAELIQNYYGFAEPISGAELERRGMEGARAVGVKFVTAEAVGLTYTDKLTVETLDADHGDAMTLWHAMGCPGNLTVEQTKQLRTCAEACAVTTLQADENGCLHTTLPLAPWAVVFVHSTT